MLSLSQLPYNVIQATFTFLNTKDLLNVALISRSCNEAASWPLYSLVVFNAISYCDDTHPRTNPFETFFRRPYLRNAVREVVLCPTSRRGAEDAKLCQDELRLLNNVETVYVTAGLESKEHTDYFEVLPSLKSLRKVVLLCTPAPMLWDSLGDVKSVEIVHDPRYLREHHLASAASKVYKILGGYGVNDGPQGLVGCQLTSFKSLEVLVLCPQKRHSPVNICQLVAELPCLQRLSFSCDFAIRRLVSGPTTHNGHMRVMPEETVPNDIHSTGLRNLVDLHIKVSFWNIEKEAGRLDATVRAIAGSSQLETLEIIAHQHSSVSQEGNELLNHVASVHGKTMKVLKTPVLRPSARVLEHILARCDKLEELWVGVGGISKLQLPAYLQWTSIRRLRLYASGTWVFGFAAALLEQTNSSLTEMHACQFLSFKNEKILSWKAFWEYDEQEARPKRRIHGPITDKIPTKETDKWAAKPPRNYRDIFALNGDEIDPDIRLEDYPGEWGPMNVDWDPQWAPFDLWNEVSTIDWAAETIRGW